MICMYEILVSGSTHKVRVMCYNLSDYVYSVTDQPDVIAEKYFSLEQLHAGDLVDATVKTVADNHVLLNVGRVTGTFLIRILVIF